MPIGLSTRLLDRGIISITGLDAVAFLQGLLSNDITHVTGNQALYAALLTPQGKFLHDMFLTKRDDRLLLECDFERRGDLIKRFNNYKLRSKVVVEDLSDNFDVWFSWGTETKSREFFADPRLPGFGFRGYFAKGKVPENVIQVDYTVYDEMRIGANIPDTNRDIEIEKSTLAEVNFDLLNGVDWKKGCYVGQELTARMHYRGLAKKRIFPVAFGSAAVPAGTLLDNEAGVMLSQRGKVGLALLKVDTVQKGLIENRPVTAGIGQLWPSVPSWMKIDAHTANR